MLSIIIMLLSIKDVKSIFVTSTAANYMDSYAFSFVKHNISSNFQAKNSEEAYLQSLQLLCLVLNPWHW